MVAWSLSGGTNRGLTCGHDLSGTHVVATEKTTTECDLIKQLGRACLSTITSMLRACRTTSCIVHLRYINPLPPQQIDAELVILLHTIFLYYMAGTLLTPQHGVLQVVTGTFNC